MDAIDEILGRAAPKGDAIDAILAKARPKESFDEIVARSPGQEAPAPGPRTYANTGPLDAILASLAEQKAAQPTLAQRAGETLGGIGATFKGGATAVGEGLAHPVDTITSGPRRRQLERGLDDMLTLGHGQRLAARIGNALGDAPENALGPETFGRGDVANTQGADQQAAPEFRQLGNIIGAAAPGATGALAKGGALAAARILPGMPANQALAAALGAGRGIAGYQLSAPVTAGLSAGAEGNRMGAALDAATDPVGNVIAGGMGAAIGGAPARVERRIVQEVPHGETTAKLSVAKKFAARIGEDGEGLASLMERDPKLEKVLATRAGPSPGSVVKTVQNRIESNSAANDMVYDAIDRHSGGTTRESAEIHASALNAAADAAEARAKELRTKAAPSEVDLRDAARAIDAPAPREVDLLEAARQIDAPKSKAAVAAEARDRHAGELSAQREAAARQAKEAIHDAKLAERDARDLRKAADAAARGDFTGGIDISNVDQRFEALRRRMKAEGHIEALGPIDKARTLLREHYGTPMENGSKAVVPGTVIPSRSVRNFANGIGRAAFAGDPMVDAGIKVRAQQGLYWAVTDLIEDAARKTPGVNAAKLKLANKDMSILLPMRDALFERGEKAKVGRTSLYSLLGSGAAGGGVGATVGASVGGAVGGIPGAIVGAKVGAASGAALAPAAARAARTLDYNLMQAARQQGGSTAAAKLMQLSRGGASDDEIQAAAKAMGITSP